MPSLADSLYRAVATRMGADEHLQVAGLLKEARKIKVGRPAAEAVRAWVDADPWAVECNLDSIVPPSRPLWLEWPLVTRSGHGGGEDAVTGCLVAPNPEHPGLLALVTGWETGDGQARHAFAVAVTDLQGLYDLSWGARNRFSRTPDESLERMMSSVSVSFPGGFADEIDILTDGSAEAREGMMRDATSEIPMVFGLLVALDRRGGLSLSLMDDGTEEAGLSPAPPVGFMSRMASRIAGTKPAPFTRKVKKGEVVSLDLRL